MDFYQEANVERALLRELANGDGRLSARVRQHNQIVLHNFQRAVTRESACGLDGCCHRFLIDLIPNQVIYPKYCPEHRTEHRRQHFRNMQTAQPPSALG